MPLIVRPFLPEEASILGAIRLEALADSPPAFAERLDVAVAQGGEDFTAAIASGSVWGVFDQDQCVGMAGLDRFVGANVEHKAMIWGVFVSPTARGSGAGAWLVQQQRCSLNSMFAGDAIQGIQPPGQRPAPA